MHDQDDPLEERLSEEDELEKQLEPFYYEINKNQRNIDAWELEIRENGAALELAGVLFNRRRQIADAQQRIAVAQRKMQQIRNDAEEFKEGNAPSL